MLVNNLDDEELIRQYLKTNATHCFDILYDRYLGKIFSKCLALLKNQTVAKDATQEIFIKVFLNLSKFNNRSKFSTWVYSITYNYCIDYLRKKKKITDLFEYDFEQIKEEPIQEVADHEILEIEIDKLKKVLELLSVGDRAILLMKYQDGLQIKEISRILDKSESAIKMKIKRAKARAKHLKSRLGTGIEKGEKHYEREKQL